MSTSNKQGGGSAWSRPLNNNNRGRFGGSGGGGSGRAPPGMEGGRDANNNNSRNNNSWRGGRSNQSQIPNSNVNRSKPSPSAAAAASTPPPLATPPVGESKEQNERNVLRERFLHLCISMIGQTVTLTQTNGLVLEGIFHTFAPFENQPKDVKNIYVIQACKMVKPPTDAAAAEGSTSFENGATVLVPASKVASVQVKSMRLNVANAAEKGVADDPFQTDSQISGGMGGDDSLVAAGSQWISAGATGAGGDALEAPPSRTNSSSRGGSGGSEAMNWRSKKSPASGGVSGNMDEKIGNWDQFAANEEKFGVKTSFDENLYTTKLDRDKIDDAKFKHAERIAREIESQVTTNIHLAEERNQKLALDFDEEDLYSGVLDKSGKDKAAREEEARKKAAAPKMSWAAAAAKKKDDEGAAVPLAAPAKKSKAAAAATPPDFSELKVSSEEKKADESEAQEKPKAAEEDKQDVEKEEDKPTSKLNVNAKSFTFNPGAKSFAPSAPAPTQHMQGPMMGGPQFVPGGPPMQGKISFDVCICLLRIYTFSCTIADIALCPFLPSQE